MVSGVYEILNTANGKRYIGSAVNFLARLQGHLHALRCNKHHSPKLQHAWNKHGASAFEFNPLLLCSKANLIMYEQRCIDGFKPAYNMSPTAGSCMGTRHTIKARENMAAAHRGKKRGPNTPEHNAKIGASKIGKPRPAEVVARISESKKGGYVSPSHALKISESLKAFHAKRRHT